MLVIGVYVLGALADPSLNERRCHSSPRVRESYIVIVTYLIQFWNPWPHLRTSIAFWSLQSFARNVFYYNCKNELTPELRWLESRIRACVLMNVPRVRTPNQPFTFICTSHIIIYQPALLICLIGLRRGHWLVNKFLN